MGIFAGEGAFGPNVPRLLKGVAIGNTLFANTHIVWGVTVGRFKNNAFFLVIREGEAACWVATGG